MEIKKVKCVFCDENFSKYNCPRCFAQYCSVKCFQHKSHENCSELFYKEQVLTELKGMKGTEEESEKIRSILRKVKEQDEQSNNIADITERLDGVDLEDTRTVWERLTGHERDMFRSHISKGNLDFLPVWIPWWDKEEPKIQELSSVRVKHLPKILKDLPNLRELLPGKSPDPCLKFCLMDILLTYTCIQRIFHGDLYDSPMETASLVLQLSKVLSESKIYSDLDSCIHCFINNLTLISDAVPVEISLKDLHDIVTSNHSYMLRVLSDFYACMLKCSKHLKKVNVLLSQQLFKISKKIYFYLVYCAEFEKDIKLLADGIFKIQKQFLDDWKTMAADKGIIEENLHKLKPSERKKLIEEVT